MGDALRQLERYDEATAAYERAVKLDAYRPGPFVGLAVLHAREQRYPQALDAYEQARRLGRHDRSGGRAVRALSRDRQAQPGDGLPAGRPGPRSREPSRSHPHGAGAEDGGESEARMIAQIRSGFGYLALAVLGAWSVWAQFFYRASQPYLTVLLAVLTLVATGADAGARVRPDLSRAPAEAAEGAGAVRLSRVRIRRRRLHAVGRLPVRQRPARSVRSGGARDGDRGDRRRRDRDGHHSVHVDGARNPGESPSVRSVCWCAGTSVRASSTASPSWC